MKEIVDLFCKPGEIHHLIMFIGILLFVIVLQEMGLGVGKMLATLIKKFFSGRSGVSINIGENGMATNGMTPHKTPKECEGCGLVVDPTKCVMHQSEHERSLRNEKEISKIWEEYAKLRDETLREVSKLREETIRGQEKLRQCLDEAFGHVNSAINTSNAQILSALAGTRSGFESPSRGGSRK